jgi:hypothetical protein
MDDEILFILLFCSETGFHYVARLVLNELTIILPHAGIIYVHLHAELKRVFSNFSLVWYNNVCYTHY